MTKEKKYRVESDLLGELNVPIDAYYGVQTQRGINNYRISCMKMYDFPDFIVSFAFVKNISSSFLLCLASFICFILMSNIKYPNNNKQ